VTWLLTGGAGYIGSHVVAAMLAADESVVVLDDMSAGIRARVPEAVPLVEASVLDTDAVRQALRAYDVTGVIHLAARKAVGESVERPTYYYRENVGGFESLLTAMLAEGVDRMVFSSSAAVYGMPDIDVVTEDCPPVPINPYGETKLAGEWLLRAVGATSAMRWVALRYFNVAGAADSVLRDTVGANLIPLVFRALDEGRSPQIFGDDYPTPDGTCIRDYVHVADLADAHVAATAALDGTTSRAVYNVGRGEGFSVKEVLATVREVTGIEVDPVVVPARQGDPARLVASAAAIRRDLGWVATRDLHDIVDSAWRAWTAGR
jgi:UDP-glucose 4-epimerase